MGFFKDLRTISAQTKEIHRNAPPVKDRMATMSSKMAEANAMMGAMAQGGAQASAAITNGVAASQRSLRPAKRARSSTSTQWWNWI